MECFFGELPERQTPHWNFILKYADQIGYIRGLEGDVRYWNVELFNYESGKSPYAFKKITPSVSYLRLEDFVDSTGISSLLEENDFELRTTRNLVIDVRGNGGGNSFSYYPLLKYCLPKGKKLGELGLTDNGALGYGQEVLYSERNCDVRIEMLEDLMQRNLQKSDEDIFRQAIRKLRELRGKGFVKEIGEEDSDIVGDSDVENVVILTDSSCCSAGDAFVYLFKMLPKVKVVGRPTQGILDYSNVAYALFDEYALVYPTSRLLSLDYGKGMMKQGVSVDEYIPWTPEHLERDVDLEYVVKRLRSYGQFFRLRNLGDNSEPFCRFHCNFSYRMPEEEEGADYVELGGNTDGSCGYLCWFVKRYKNEEIVLEGCGGEEYIFRRNDEKLERFA